MGTDRSDVAQFGLVAVAQAMPLWAYHPAAAGMRVHLSNGFYANAVFDELLAQSNDFNPTSRSRRF
jgi:NAD(P)H-quinone oxidoreductase subunit 5